jgi:ABC-2 type transport system ATP-binding protein
MQANGQTVILTTHSMEEAETLCQRVAIIDRGKVIACDAPARLVGALDADARIYIAPHWPAAQVLALEGVRGAQLDGSRLAIETGDPLRTLVQLYELAQRSQVHLSEMTLRQPNLEDVFLQLSGRPLSETEPPDGQKRSTQNA